MPNNKEKRIRKRKDRQQREREQGEQGGQGGEGEGEVKMGEALSVLRQFVEEEDRKEMEEGERRLQEAKGGAVWIGLPSCTSDESALMLVGPRNCGKSTLSAHLLSLGNAAVLDCDLGRNCTL